MSSTLITRVRSISTLGQRGIVSPVKTVTLPSHQLLMWSKYTNHCDTANVGIFVHSNVLWNVDLAVKRITNIQISKIKQAHSNIFVLL